MQSQLGWKTEKGREKSGKQAIIEVGFSKEHSKAQGGRENTLLGGIFTIQIFCHAVDKLQ